MRELILCLLQLIVLSALWFLLKPISATHFILVGILVILYGIVSSLRVIGKR